MTDNPIPGFFAAIWLILEMRGKGVEGFKGLDFEVSDKKIGTFGDLIEEFIVKKWTEKVWAAFLREKSGIWGLLNKSHG